MSVDPRKNTELEILYRISQVMAHQQDVSALLNEALDILETELGLSRGTLTLRRPGTDVLVIEASRGLTPREEERGQYQLGEGITGRVGATGKPVIISDVSKEPEFLNRTKSRGNAGTAFICVPIIHNRETIGTLSIDRPIAGGESLTHDMSFMQLVANILAEAVEARNGWKRILRRCSPRKGHV